MIRQLKNTRDLLVQSQTKIHNMLEDLIMTAPEEIKIQLANKTDLVQAKICASFTSDSMITITDSTKYSLKTLSEQWIDHREKAHTIERQITHLIKEIQPALLNEYGIGFNSAAAILIAVGENTERIASEAALAKLADVCPIPASSGKVVRYRLNRGGNRQLNRAFHIITLNRMREDEQTRQYVAKRQAEGKTLREIRRTLKRYLTRRIYQTLKTPTTSTNTI